MLIYLLEDSVSEQGSLQESLQAIFGSNLMNWQSLLIQLGASAIMILVLAKFLIKPVRNILNARQEYVTSNIEASKKAKLDAEKANEEAYAKLKELNSKSAEILDEARNNAQKISDKMILDAENEIKDKRSAALKQIEQDKENAREEVKKEIVNVALDASTKVLGREVNSKDNERFVNEFIKEVGEDK
jgi:F-type H+-transporting ATPase subunit b